MKQPYKKGQSALEYLLTYGWAILIVIIVGASLYALGVFNPGTFTGKRSTGFTQFQLVDHKVDTLEDVTLVFGNRIGKSVTLGDIRAEFKQDTCTSSQLDGNTMAPNEQLNITFDCSTPFGDLDRRASYSMIIEIDFTDPDSDLSHTDIGTIFGATELP